MAWQCAPVRTGAIAQGLVSGQQVGGGEGRALGTGHSTGCLERQDKWYLQLALPFCHICNLQYMYMYVQHAWS